MTAGAAPVTLALVQADPEVVRYVEGAQNHLRAMGFTEHGVRHVTLVAQTARNLLAALGFPAREAELAAVAGYLHDMGNLMGRHDHGQSGALMAFTILKRLGMDPDELVPVLSAIANHEEEHGQPSCPVAAALVLADKSDVHRARVQNRDFATFDSHDRVNYAVEQSLLSADPERHTVTLALTIDTSICPIMEYFEIFLVRMVMCRRAADFLDCSFHLEANGTRLL